MLIAIAIFSLVLVAIYSSWTAILRSAKSGQQAAATVQRLRICVRVLEDSLGSAMCFIQNHRYYGFVAENGSDPTLSFVAHLSRDFPRSGSFGDFDVRRLIFSVESGRDSSRQLVLRQIPLMMDLDSGSESRVMVDEKNHPLVLAKNVREFKVQFWDQRRSDWVDEWKLTNQLPRGIVVTLKLADTSRANSAEEEITRIISLPASGVPVFWQMPRIPPGMPGPGGVQPPGAMPPGSVPPGTQLPGVIQTQSHADHPAVRRPAMRPSTLATGTSASSAERGAWRLPTLRTPHSALRTPHSRSARHRPDHRHDFDHRPGHAGRRFCLLDEG